MLVTGLFDELAWTIVRRYGLNVSSQQTVLRQRQKDNKFFREVNSANAALHAFLCAPRTQATIGLFYPARDQVQHRTMLPTRFVEEPPPRRVLAQLPSDTLSEIRSLSRDQGADWGVVDGGTSDQVDPYLFTLAAVQAVAGVANGVLERLEWERYADALPEETREEKRSWFRTEVGMALMNRHHNPRHLPAYF